MCPRKTGITKSFWLSVLHFIDNGKPTWATDWKLYFSQRETSSGFRLLLSINSCQKVRRLSRANKSWASVLQDFCPLSRKFETIAIHAWALLPERNLLWIQQISGRSWLARLESCVTQFLWSQYELYWLAQVGKRQREAQSHEIIGRWTLRGVLIDWMWELCGGLGFLAQAFGWLMELLTEKGNAGRGAGRNTMSSVLDTWIRATCEGTKLRYQAHGWIYGPGGWRRRDLGGLFGCLWHRVDNGSHVTSVGL